MNGNATQRMATHGNETQRMCSDSLLAAAQPLAPAFAESSAKLPPISRIS
jgi:hypothetical protein